MFGVAGGAYGTQHLQPSPCRLQAMGVQVAQPFNKVVLKPLASKIFKVLAQQVLLIQGTVMLEIQKLSSNFVSFHPRTGVSAGSWA